MSLLSLQVGRFAGVGTIATLVHVSAAFLAHQSGAAGPMIANTVGFACAVAVTYLGNFYWTFPGAGSHIRSLQRFSMMAGLTLIWTSSVVYIAGVLLDWPFIVALAIILATAPPINFVLSRLWVFQRGRASLQWSDLEIPAMAVLFLAAAWFYAGTMLNHDTSWYLIATSRWLDGAELYRDIVEINPPLAFYLTAPAVLLSRATGLAAHHAFVLQVIALSLASLLWFRALLQRSPIVTEPRRQLLLIAAFAALCLTPVGEFGQRDHLMVIFALPYIGLMAFTPASGRVERCIIGAFALPGLALKPYFLVLPLILGLLMILRQRRVLAPFTAEHLVIGSGSVLYALSIWIFYPAYITEIVAAGRLVYAAYDGPVAGVLLVPGFFAAAALLALTAGLPKGTDREVSVTLLAVTAAFVIVYLTQFKGWGYQRIPIYSALCLWWTWLAVALFDSGRLREIGDFAVRTALLGLAAAIIALQVLQGPYQNAAVSIFGPHLRDASSFMALTTNVSITYPLANLTGAEPTTRYSALWLIPGAVSKLAAGGALAKEDRDALEKVLERARRTTSEDFVHGRPDVVLVDARATKPYFGGADFDYIDFFQQDPRFRAAWQDYSLVATEAGFEVWRRDGDQQQGQ
jgi:putative flippase GtrA